MAKQWWWWWWWQMEHNLKVTVWKGFLWVGLNEWLYRCCIWLISYLIIHTLTSKISDLHLDTQQVRSLDLKSLLRPCPAGFDQFLLHIHTQLVYHNHPPALYISYNPKEKEWNQYFISFHNKNFSKKNIDNVRCIKPTTIKYYLHGGLRG